MAFSKDLFLKKYFFITFFFLEITKITSLTPALKHSSNICSKIDFDPNGHSSLGNAFVKGSILVPSPASGIIACLTIKIKF